VQQAKPVSAGLGKPSGAQAQYTLEGSVRRQGEQARISIRLSRTTDQATIWTESFDRNVGDALSLQSEIAQRIGNELQVQVLGRNYPEAHAAIAQIKLMHDWDWRGAREHALRALQLNPSSPEAHAVYARYLRTAGNVREAVNQHKQAVALDPLSVDMRAQLTLAYFFARDYRNGVATARSLLTDDPQFAHGVLCVDLGYLNQFDESVAECRKALPLDG